MRILKGAVSTCILMMGITANSSYASSISYDLNQSNALPDGPSYLTVTIEDGLSAGDIDFTVLVNTENFSHVGPNFGMDNFYFNYNDDLSVYSCNIINLDPDSWKILTGYKAGGSFGFFDFKIKGTDSTRTELLTFTIAGVDGDTIYDYALGYQNGDDAYFAAHVADSDAIFATSPVPVPAAVWLFVSGLLALTGIAKSRCKS